MLTESIIKTIMAFCVHYYLESRFFYAYEINGDCSIPFTIDVEKIIKNRLCKLIFPREFKNYREFLDGTSKISILGLLHCMIFYFPVQIAYLVSVIINFSNTQIAEKILITAFNIMFLGFAVYLVLFLLAALIDYVRKTYYANRRKRK